MQTGYIISIAFIHIKYSNRTNIEIKMIDIKSIYTW